MTVAAPVFRRGDRQARPRPAFKWLAGGLAAIGIFLIGDGLYIKAKAALAQVLLERAWAQTLETGSAVKPWSWADTWPVARITVPRLGRSAIVLNGTSGQALAFGPGLIAAGPRPGDPGLAVIAAHRDTHFRFLKHIRTGDRILLTHADGTELAFEIRETGIVDANDSGLYQDGGTPRLALVTCWPFDAKTHGPKRFVAIAERID